MRRFWSRLLVAVVFTVMALVWIVPELNAEETKKDSTGRKETKIPDEFAVTITGRILSPQKEPLVGMNVLVSETDPKKVAVSWRTGEDGKLANPTGDTDKSGRFTIKADRRFWEKTGYFTLQGGFIPGTLQNAGILRGSYNEPVILKDDGKTKKFDLGDIIISQQ